MGRPHARNGPCSHALALAVLIAVLFSAPTAQAILLPISLFDKASPTGPAPAQVPCSEQVLEFDAKAVRLSNNQQGAPNCGAATQHSWRVWHEADGGSEVALGPLASQQKLTLSQGVLSKPGTYVVQLTVRYERCAAQQGQAKFSLGSPCANAAGDTQQQGSPTFELQSCTDVTEPGKRKLTLRSQGSSPARITWQLLPASQAGGVSAESGQQPLSCSGSGCVLFVGAGSGKVHPGASYAIKYSSNAASGSADAGFSLGAGGFSFSAGSDSGSSSAWRELAGPKVDKCPPKITRSGAAVMGACGSKRWLEMQAAAVDLEEGGAAGSLKFHWYVLSARTQDVVQEASGPAVKLEIGQGPGQVPDGRRYLVKLLVTAQAGGQVSSTREAVGDVVDVPSC